MKDVYILGIETSCDETSASIVKNGTTEIATVVLTQIDKKLTTHQIFSSDKTKEFASVRIKWHKKI